MINLKDCLHLYLGCNVLIECEHFVEGSKILKIKDRLEKISTDGVCECESHSLMIDEGIKPILRPLSDMTDDEKMMYSNYYFHMNGISYFEERIRLDAEALHFLLSKRLDLFGLIPAGLAIDATTLKTTF